MKIKSNEYELKGEWIKKSNSIVQNLVCERIEYLISNHLVELATDSSGWFVLYQDPSDKRYWELSYPHSDKQGGGPPVLKNISFEESRKFFNSNND
jgi:hypothetical protein